MQTSPDTQIFIYGLIATQHQCGTPGEWWTRLTAEPSPARRGGWAREPKKWRGFFGLKCLRLKCKQEDSRRPQQRGGALTELQPEPGFIYIYLSVSLSSHEQDAEMQTATEHGQLIYCFHKAELINDCKRAASWTHQQLAKRKCMASNAEANTPNLITVTPLDCKIRAVNTNYRHLKLRHPKNKDFLKERMCFWHIWHRQGGDLGLPLWLYSFAGHRTCRQVF